MQNNTVVFLEPRQYDEVLNSTSLPIDSPSHPPDLMVVSRDPNLTDELKAWLSSRVCRAVLVDDVDAALHRYRIARPKLVALDVITSADLAVLEQFRRIDTEVPIVAVAREGSTITVVEAMRLGASDVMNAPVRPRDLEAALAIALAERRIKRQGESLQREVAAHSRHLMLFGLGHAMAELRDLIERVAGTDVPVLIQGESGTGKELVARALAASSDRRGKPFVKINCAALPGDLFESELFGFERGAFSGAEKGKPGKFEMANNGTIFLDEVGEIPLHLQAKLLQVLQDGHFSRLGGHGDVHTAVRIIAATNRNLDQAVLDGQFREDLHFRLNVIPVRVPPLRERREDIPQLVELFLKRWSVFYKRRYRAISSEMMSACNVYGWPGNVRELENLIQRTVVLGTEVPARRALSRVLDEHRSAASCGESKCGRRRRRATFVRSNRCRAARRQKPRAH